MKAGRLPCGTTGVQWHVVQGSVHGCREALEGGRDPPTGILVAYWSDTS